jgi:uncharacterized OsmC-like protein
MKMVVKSGSFEIVTDKLGGEAPSPIEYVLAALAGCFNIVGEIVAREMGIAIEDLKVEVSGVFNASKLMTGVGERAGYREINVKVLVKSGATADVLRTWLEGVRERCPVEDNLANQTPVRAYVEKL